MKKNTDQPGQNRNQPRNPDSGGIESRYSTRGSQRSASPNDAQEKSSLLPAIALPKGGGAIRGIDEKFEVNPATGTGSSSIPLPVSPGRSGFQPQLSVGYNSGAGNGPFGLGWGLSVPAITRKTDKGLPKYQDEIESDLFILSGAEDLVPALNEVGEQWVRDAFTENEFKVQRYRPRTEGLFARIEKWRHTQTGAVFWKSITPDNITSIFGKTPDCRIADPEDSRHIFSWLLQETYDDKGNVMVYEYKQENSDGVDPTKPQEGKRLRAGTSFAQQYLKRVKYGNRRPFERDNWLFELVFDYGEHDAEIPTPQEVQPWPVRRDPFSTYRAGFEIRTWRLCRQVLMFHHFSELGVAPFLASSAEFEYQEDAHLTRLVAATHSGYDKGEGEATYRKKSLPPLEFGYSEARIDEEVREIDPESLENLPGGLDGGYHQWVDLDGEGLSGVLTRKSNAWYYKRNLGNGRFAPSVELASQPSLVNNGGRGLQLMDIDGNGLKELVLLDDPVSGFFEKNREDGWDDFVDFEGMPNVDFGDPNLRMIDLTGDGHADIFISNDDAFIYYASKADEGFDAPEHISKALDEEDGPALVFADAGQSIFLAEMSGGGLTDIVRIRNGEVCYWPNLGYGRFGAKIIMDTPPYFDLPDRFDPARLRLADIDGSGTTDIIYLRSKSIDIYLNQAGNDWSEPIALSSFPVIDNLSSVSVMDLLGNGTACLVWSSPLHSDANRPMRYIDLMGGVKPHLLISTVDNMGSETRLEYAPSTKFYLQDRADGKPWVTKLPFPVHVVEKIEMREGVTNTKLVTTYKYHHGFFDGVEREFRGFGFVEQLDTESFSSYNGKGLFTDPPEVVDEEFYQPPVLTKTWFHTGAYLVHEKISQHYLDEYYSGDPRAVLLADTEIPDGLTAQEEREACRALRGTMLRQEVYALDDSPESKHPYTVAESKSHIKLIQPQKENPHAVFYVCNCETLTYHYERDPKDPRIAHSHTLEIDEKYGMPLKTASIAYPRRGAGYEQEQTALHIVYDEVGVTHLDESNEFYRIGLPVESRSYEITGLQPAGDIFEKAELRGAIAAANEIPYESGPTSGLIEKRLIERACTLYLKNGLSGPLPKGVAESLALPFESYQLAFSESMLQKIFDGRAEITREMLEGEGKYVELEGDGHWWIPSGRVFFFPDPDNQDVDFARSHFYLPHAARDPFGNDSYIIYDDYDLLITEAEDALHNIVRAENDYRVLQPHLITDPNGNRQAVAFDELGMATKTAVMGKEGETDPAKMGDTLDDPTARMEYQLFNWMHNGKPNFVHTFAREKHGAENTRFQESYVYSDGLGREVMTKVQAEPGLAPGRDPNGELLRDDQGELMLVDTSPEVRWVGNGRTVFDNKGNPVKQYEPFFSTTPEYEDEADLVEIGVTPILRYDPLGRLIRTDLPNGTFSKVEFDPWQQTIFDPNDTVLESLWYAERLGGSLGPEEQRAARLTEAHADTPAKAHLDTLGRAFLTEADNGAEGIFATRVVLDIEGNVLSTIDARGNMVMTQRFNMLGQRLYIDSMDAGEDYAFFNVAGSPIYTWDSRGHQTRQEYDELQRPSKLFVLFEESGKELLVQKVVYGESIDNPGKNNLRGQAHQLFDGAGVVTNEAFDFKGNPLHSTRQLAQEYKQTIDWSDSPALETEIFAVNGEFDALNRPVRSVSPDGSVHVPVFNEANFLESLSVHLRGADQDTGFVSNIDYDAKGGRTKIDYANGTQTTYEYDLQTFRLTNLKTLRKKDNKLLQDLHYTYDPVGNIMEIRDDAQQTVYFKNTVVEPHGQYEYDPLYRLTKATGREHTGQHSSAPPDDKGIPILSPLPHPNDAKALQRYVETYAYDPVGNILQLSHRVNGSGWRRFYEYATDSNRLLATSLPGDNSDGPYSGKYDYDAHGNMIRMPHLPEMTWDYADQLQSVDLQGGGRVFFVYDASGERSRKVHEHQGGLIEERLYIGGFEIYRKRRGNTVDLERETLHLMDDQQRVAIVGTKTIDHQTPIRNPKSEIRNQYGNHLGSGCLELDEEAAIISYEEYHPYGTSAFRAGQSAAEVSLKRYRYIGKERDDETALYYCSARYYAPWLGRWTSTDPRGFADGLNLFRYSQNKPMVYKDPMGTKPVKVDLDQPDPDPMDQIMSDLKRMPSPEHKGISKAEQGKRKKALEERRKRLRRAFSQLGPFEARALYRKLGFENNGDILYERFHGVLSTAVRQELLDILTMKLSVAPSERDLFERAAKGDVDAAIYLIRHEFKRNPSNYSGVKAFYFDPEKKGHKYYGSQKALDRDGYGNLIKRSVVFGTDAFGARVLLRSDMWHETQHGRFHTRHDNDPNVDSKLLSVYTIDHIEIYAEHFAMVNLALTEAAPWELKAIHRFKKAHGHWPKFFRASLKRRFKDNKHLNLLLQYLDKGEYQKARQLVTKMEPKVYNIDD